MSLRIFQENVNRSWNRQVENPCSKSSGPEHALVHIVKATGALAAALNDAQHDQRPLRSVEVAKYLADLVICAARFGDNLVDLEVACRERFQEKFPRHA